MKFSMIVVTTSCAPVQALSAPGMKPHSAPAAAAASIAIGMATSPGAVAKIDPMPAAMTAPIRN